MTCIVGIKSKGLVFIGGDSAATHGTVPKLLAAGKVWRIGEFVMGGAGTERTNTLIRHSFKPPRIAVKDNDSTSLDRYMNTLFAKAMRKLMQDNSCIGKDEETEQEDYGGSLLIGVRGQLYLMDCSFAAYRTGDNINATGSAHEVALGALHALEVTNPHGDAKLKLKIALEAAERWQEGVRAPFTILATSQRAKKKGA